MPTRDDPRIEQFKKMSEADPTNELGHFSLGKAYLDAGRFGDAVQPLSRALELNPKMSKAYQLLGEVLDRGGRRNEAVEAITRGVTVADQQGDRMPRDAMADRLREWNVPVPAFREATKPAAGGAIPTTTATAVGFRCSRCGRPTGQLPKPPFKGPLGNTIFTKVCSTCWREWIAMGTKVINELGLVLSQPVGQQTYDQYMMEFLQLEDR